MSHYFTNDNVASDEKIVNVKIKGKDFKFYVDNGVFSKKGLDFGTRTLLENIDLSKTNGDVLDFGCGYGPIGIYLARESDCTVDMVDINKRALSLALKNAKINNVNVNIFFSDVYENVNKKYDYIVSNPPIRVGKKILYEILFGAYDYLKEKGTMIIVVNKNQGAKSLVKHLEEKYRVEVIARNKGFYVIKMIKG